MTQLLRPRLPPVLDFLSRYDALPLVALPPPPSPLSVARQTASAGVSLDAAVGDALDAFGISALGDEA